MTDVPDRRSDLSRARTAAAAVILAAVTLAVYGQVVGFDFVNYDDPHYVYLNEHVTSGLTWDNLLWSLTARDVGLWHPLTWLSHQWDTSVAGPRAAGYRHAVNLTLHVASVIVVYLLVLRLSGSHWGSLLVALLFAVHPQHVQSVAWITERKDTLSGVLVLGSVLAFSLSREIPTRRGAYALSVVLFALAALSKPSVVPLPLILWLIDYWFGPPSAWRARVWRAAPYVVIASLVAVITVLPSGEGDAGNGLTAIMPLDKRLLLMPIGLLHYIRTLFVPWPLPFFVGAPASVSVLRAVISLMILVALGAAVWRAGRRAPLIRFGGLWFLIMWLPVSGLVAFSQYFVADRYTYLPHIGAFVAAVWIVGRWIDAGSRWRLAAVASCVFVVTVFAGLAYKQTGYWRDSVTLFQRELEINPRSAPAAIHAGEALARGGQPERALAYFELGVELEPQAYLARAYRGHALRELGRVDEAADAFREAVAVGPTRPDAHASLGALLAQRGDISASIEVLEHGLALFPDSVSLLNHLGYVSGFYTAEPESGIDYLQRVLAVDRANIYALNAIAALYYRTGRPWLGAAYYRLVLEHDPSDATARDMVEQYERSKRRD